MTPKASLAVLCAAALVVRFALMWMVPPGHGDATGSYAYRATLLIDGQWAAMWTMWHPPGLSVVIAALSLATGQLLTPWWTANVINLAASAGLVLAADRLIAPRVQHGWMRASCAALIAFNSGLILWQSSPLSEALFVLACLLTVVVYDRDQVAGRHALWAGLLAGAASALRFEGVMLAAGLAAYVAWRRRSIADVLILFAGWALTAGWIYVRWDYLLHAVEWHRGTMPVAPEDGALPNLLRLPRVVFDVFRYWLPNLLPWPYWILLAFGVRRLHRSGPDGRRLNQLFVATIVPVLAFVAVTEPHLRTGVTLLAPAMIWMTVALDGLLAGPAAERKRWRRAVIALVVASSGLGLLRVAVETRSFLSAPDVVRDEVQLLRAHAAPQGKIWAFGYERNLYGALGWPIRSDYRTQPVVEGALLADRSAADFTAVLRANGYRYLMFDLPPGSTDRVLEEGWKLLPPRRSMLSEIAAEPARFGLRPLAAPAPLQAFEIRP